MKYLHIEVGAVEVRFQPFSECMKKCKKDMFPLSSTKCYMLYIVLYIYYYIVSVSSTFCSVGL